LQKKRYIKRANFSRVFPKLHIFHLTGSCTEPFNCHRPTGYGMLHFPATVSNYIIMTAYILLSVYSDFKR